METRYWLDKDDLQWILKRDYPAKIKGEDGKPTGETRMATEVCWATTRKPTRRSLRCSSDGCVMPAR